MRPSSNASQAFALLMLLTLRITVISSSCISWPIFFARNSPLKPNSDFFLKSGILHSSALRPFPLPIVPFSAFRAPHTARFPASLNAGSSQTHLTPLLPPAGVSSSIQTSITHTAAGSLLQERLLLLSPGISATFPVLIAFSSSSILLLLLLH